MTSSQPQMSGVDLSSTKPEMFSASLAHVLHKQGEKTAVVGQAWLASSSQLITCGHVVEPFLDDTASLLVKFPTSGNEYQIDSIRVHPRYVKQDDQIVRFDAAALTVRLRGQDLEAQPLPVCYNITVKNQAILWTTRYPAHLGSISSGLEPLSQTGHYLGRLFKDDYSHLLHDLPLSPGDSGAPLLLPQGVVAMHCGDTASLPGLNLPTTSIRMALSVNALRDLGVPGVVFNPALERNKKDSTGRIIWIFLYCFCLSAFAAIVVLGAVYVFRLETNKAQHVAPLHLSMVPADPKTSQGTTLRIESDLPVRIYVVYKDDEHTRLIYPARDALDASFFGLLQVELPQDVKSNWESGKGQIYCVGLDRGVQLIAPNGLSTPTVPTTIPRLIDPDWFWKTTHERQADGTATLVEIPPSALALANQTSENSAQDSKSEAKPGSPSETRSETSETASSPTQTKPAKSADENKKDHQSASADSEKADAGASEPNNPGDVKNTASKGAPESAKSDSTASASPSNASSKATESKTKQDTDKGNQQK
jgi:hypothetical protein